MKQKPVNRIPTKAQSNVCTILILILSLLLSPFTLLATLIAYVSSLASGRALGQTSARLGPRKTVLINGGRANKALDLCRAFKRDGHRVLMAEEAYWGTLTCARFSRAVDAYFPLPDSSTQPEAYARTIKDIVARERVDVWIPCSSVHASTLDAEIALDVHTERLGGSDDGGRCCDCFIQGPEVAEALHWKDQFATLCKEIGVRTPDTRLVTSVESAIDFLYAPGTTARGCRYILKPLNQDDGGRDDLTLLPLSYREATEAYLRANPTPLSEEHPYVLQEFVRGREYATHAAVRDGKQVAFVACPSNPMIMRYRDVRTLEHNTDASVSLEAWSDRFLRAYKRKLDLDRKTGHEYALNGHFSFDIMIDEHDNIYPLECNARAHTAICLLASNPNLASSYLKTPTTEAVIRPVGFQPPHSWLAYALPLALIRALHLPRAWLHALHPQLHSTLHPSARARQDLTLYPLPDKNLAVHIWRYFSGAEKDGFWDWTDPVPFFVLCHVQWPWLLLRLMWRGERWTRLNVSTSRIWQC